LKNTVANLKKDIMRLENLSENEKNLLEDLISRGIFPSFSFPLDVVKFEARGSKKKFGRNESEEHVYASASQDLKVGLSEYTPGKILVINKQSFKVAGVGPFFPKHPVNQVKEWNLSEQREIFENEEMKINQKAIEGEWKYYHRCKSKFCGVTFKHEGADFNTSEDPQICPNCLAQGKDEEELNVVSNRMITPEVLRPIMVSYDRRNIKKSKKPNVSSYEMKADEAESDSTDMRKLGHASLPHPRGNWESDGMETILVEGDEWKKLTVLRFRDEGQDEVPIELITVNDGSNGHGYKICNDCGRIDLSKKDNPGEHNRPYAIPYQRIRSYVNKKYPEGPQEIIKNKVRKLAEEARDLCTGNFEGPFVFGHTFRTDLVIFRFKVSEPLTTYWDTAWFNSAVTSIKEALITETTKILQIMDREISGNYRKVVLGRENDQSKDQFIDIFLYDNVSGGAGLVRRIGTENVETILNSTFDRLGGRECENGGCDRVCMNCLLDFRNQMEQDLLNRPLGFQLINNLRYDSIPEYEHSSIEEKENNSDKKIQQLKTILTSSFQNFGIDINGENLVISDNEKTRNIYPHSILRGVKTLPEDHINYRKLESIEVDDDSIITVPFELLNNSPHIVFEIMTTEISSDEDEDSDDWF
jgi:hypothetical protein